jgi:hypothetical protein
MRGLVRLFVACIGLGLVAGSVQSAVIHVPDDYETIQEAINAAVWGDEVRVAAGIYSDPTHTAGAGDTTKCCVILKSGVSLRGAGAGLTIIDADSSGRGIHVYQCESVQISDLTITGGYAEIYGGAILCRQSSPLIERCEIAENHDGGIATIEASHPTIRYCLLHFNVAKNGGGIEVEAGCHPTLYDCDIVDNQAPFAAGAMLRGSATLDHCRVLRNRTTGAVSVMGGGILAVDSASPIIVDCEIRDNQCSGDGGGIALMGEGTSAVIEGCLVADNLCTGLESRGGGIFVAAQSTPAIRGCVISGNRTTGPWSDGGGLYVQYSGVDLAHCTFYANWTAGSGYLAGNLGIETSDFIPIPIAITHSILAFSPDGRGVWCTGTGTPPAISCCDVYGNAGGDGLCGTGTGNFSLDPQLCDPAGGNFHVADASPCAPGNHPEGPGACDGLLIGARREGCFSGVEDPAAPSGVRLLGSRPNPFRDRTAIALSLSRPMPVRLEVLDISGRCVALLHDGPLDAGLQTIAWDGRTQAGARAASGVYFYRLSTGGTTEGLRLLRLR